LQTFFPKAAQKKPLYPKLTQNGTKRHKKNQSGTKKTKVAQSGTKKTKPAQKKPNRHKKNQTGTKKTKVAQSGTKKTKKNHFGPNRHKPAQSGPNLAQLGPKCYTFFNLKVLQPPKSIGAVMMRLYVLGLVGFSISVRHSFEQFCSFRPAFRRKLGRKFLFWVPSPEISSFLKRTSAQCLVPANICSSS
jgi:hypothetical protein